MRMTMVLFVLALNLALPGFGADLQAGEREEKRACLMCHGVRIIHVQRLSRETWERELDKMVRWGAVLQNRPALVEYLVTNFGESVPDEPAVLSRDGRLTKADRK